MSGIEVVGVVLGAFPLLISAFEHYRDVAKAANLLANWEEQNLKSLNDAKDEEVFFRQNMVVLLWPLVKEEIVDKDELDKLLADPTGSGWQVEDVEKALEARLGDIAGRYCCLMQDLQTLMIKLLYSLGFHRAKFQGKIAAKGAKRSISDLAASANAQLLKRIDQVKFGLGKASRDEMLAEIQMKNEKLEKLLRGCDKVTRLQESERVIVPRKASRSLLQYWRHAGRIYALFQDNWGCSCRNRHCAHIWLHHPSPNANELKLLVMWAPNTQPPNGMALWRPQDLQVSWYQGERFQSALQLATSTGIDQTLVASTNAPGESIFRRAAKRVKFDVSPKSPSPAAVGSKVPNGPKTPVSQSSPSSTKQPSKVQAQCDGLIRDLCKAMASCGVTPQQLGALTDPAGLQYLVCSQPDARVTPAEMTLYDVLHDKKGKPLKRRSNRVQIALAVASAHLQLRSTPWARRQWEAKDILFPQDPHDPDKIIVEPYISADFNDVLPVREQQPKHTDRSFASLGIMLLELCFGSVLEEHDFWARPGFEQNKADPDVRAMVASKWADEVEGEAGPDFAAAVTWCLRESPATLDGEQWRKDLADQVVMPLQHCWDCIKPKATC